MLASTTLLVLLATAPPTGNDAPGEPSAGEAAAEEPDSAAEPLPSATDTTGPAYLEVLETIPPEEQDETQAFALFRSGETAFAEGRYADAIEFFAQAYRQQPRKNLLYSLGSAHRRLYEATLDREQIRYAILRYNQFLELAPEGIMTAEARRQITALLARSELAAPDDKAPVTRIMISTTIAGAWMRIGGGEKARAPGVLIVQPGRHSVDVGAEGYASETQIVEAAEGQLSVLNYDLEQLPGEIEVTGPRGAEVSIDGRAVGTLPLDRVIVVEPGVHFVAVTRNGHVAYTRQLEVGPDESASVTADMRNSTQRILSYSLLGLGGAGLVTSFVTLGVALDAQSEARVLEDSAGIGTDDYQRYLDQVDRRNAFRATSIATGAVGAGLLVTGVVLFALDRPQVEIPLYDRTRASASRPTLSFRPHPGGGGVLMRF